MTVGRPSNGLGGQGSNRPFAERGLRTRRGRWSDAARGSAKGLGLGLGFLGLGCRLRFCAAVLVWAAVLCCSLLAARYLLLVARQTARAQSAVGASGVMRCAELRGKQ